MSFSRGIAMTYDDRQFYIDGKWVDPAEPKTFQVINPATETVAGVISMGGPKDVDLAVAAARRAFDAYSRTTPAERLALMERILVAYKAHYDEIAEAISTEMGAPITLAKGSQTRIGVGHISAMIDVLKTFKFEEVHGSTRLVQEPVGVCALITPWNWPMNQVAAKVVPALAAGCTMVLKPSEYAPFSAILWAKVMHEAGVPAGVFNLINGDGHSRRRAALLAPRYRHGVLHRIDARGHRGRECGGASVKRVHQELGGKSPNVLLDDADFETRRQAERAACISKFGAVLQCADAHAGARRKTKGSRSHRQAGRRRVVVGDPKSEKTTVGPLVSKLQFDRVEGYIEKGIAEGAS
jgi:aldehyde dehydrogenase (NAD+)